MRDVGAADDGGKLMKFTVEEVFVTEGVPEYTFVKPPNYNEILIDIRRAGKPVIIEGQSGSGKTCTTRKVLEQLSDRIEYSYLSARHAPDVEKIIDIAKERTTGTYVIDDFHRLSPDTQENLADMAKLAAEQGEAAVLPKLIIIGINQVGASLIQMVPDIAKRCGIHRIEPGTKELVNSLVVEGCRLLKVEPFDASQIYAESRGDYWLSQHLCQAVCTMNDVLETLEVTRQIDVNLDALRPAVIARLNAAYYTCVKEFCRGKRFRPSNDPYYRLLQAISQQDSSIVDLNMLANSIEEARGSINNIKERRLSVLLETKPVCSQHFYYNADTKYFAIEDPALFYFLKHLNWEQLRTDCGFKKDQRQFDYDFAISFAGENRDLAKSIADQLETLDTTVFFDEYFETNFLGKAWSKEFKRIFAEASRLVICLLDSNHLNKIWPTFERECFQPRVEEEAVIPVYLDDASFPGIPKDIVGIIFRWDSNDPEWQNKVTDEIVFKVIDRLD
jgi:hypothetical protein